MVTKYKQKRDNRTSTVAGVYTLVCTDYCFLVWFSNYIITLNQFSHYQDYTINLQNKYNGRTLLTPTAQHVPFTFEAIFLRKMSTHHSISRMAHDLSRLTPKPKQGPATRTSWKAAIFKKFDKFSISSVKTTLFQAWRCPLHWSWPWCPFFSFPTRYDIPLEVTFKNLSYIEWNARPGF